MPSIRIQQAFYVLFAILYFSISMPAGYAGLGIDASWHEALAMAVDKHLIFGEDFIFNYGPLGYLNTGVYPKTASIYFNVLLQIFVLVNYLFFIRLGFRYTQNTWLVILLALLIYLPWGFFADSTFTLFYIQLFWLLYCWRVSESLPLVAVSIVTVLIFYIKVNLSIISYGVFYGSVVYFILSKRISWAKGILAIVLQLGLTVALARWLHVAIPAYLNASLQIIDAYQDGMSAMLLTKREFLPLFTAEMLMLAVAAWYILKNMAYLFDYVYLYLLVALAWFLNFKQAHTAIAHYNVFGYFLLMPMLSLLLIFFVNDKLKPDFKRLFVIVLIIQMGSTQLIRWYMGGNTLNGYLFTYPPMGVVTELQKGNILAAVKTGFESKNPVNYLRSLIQYKHGDYLTDTTNLNQRLLPSKIIKTIGNNTVDILPWEVSYIYFNQLNYNPRPVIQSYQANNEWLALKNGEKYGSPNAPAYVLARLEYFREQNPFWIDQPAYRQLFSNYSLIDTAIVRTDTLFLFRRNAQLVNSKFQESEIIIGEMSQPLPIKSDTSQLVYLKANIQYSLLAKVARLFFQPPPLYVEVRYQTGRVESFRIPPPILKSGILINRKVTTMQEFALLNLKKGTENERVVNIRFFSQYPEGFVSRFSYQFEYYDSIEYN